MNDSAKTVTIPKIHLGQRVMVNDVAYEIDDMEYDNEITLKIVDESQATEKYGVGGTYIIVSEITILEWLAQERQQ